MFRRWAIDALHAAGRSWRLAFVSQSIGAVESVAAQGLAVTVVKAGTFPSRLRPLTGSEGLPPLPAADVCLHQAPDPPPAARLLAAHLSAGIAGDLPRFIRLMPG